MARRADGDRLAQQARASGHGQVIQVGGDFYIYPPGGEPPPRAPATLPAGPGRLVGRDGEVGELLELLDPQRPGPSAVVVAGLPGVGKTSLALRAAHEAVVVRGWFPGGVLFVDLGGYDPDRQLTAGQALGDLLRQLGVADADLPLAEEQAGRYQSELAHLADAGKPVLLVADNASTTTKVEALVPARSDHRLLVTSRDILASVPARLIDLDVLPPPAAADLIAQVLTGARPRDQRARDEAAGLRQVAELCGRLPLALQITAEILKADPGLSVTAMAAELQDASTRLAALSREDGGGRTRAVRAAFEASYRRLGIEQARLFRLLALNPGPDTATEAAAALAGAPAGQVRPLLAVLAGASLVTEQPVGGNRWRMHDLIRLYAAELGRDAARDDQSEAALDRLLDYYRDTADAAVGHLRFLSGQDVPERFDGPVDLEQAALFIDTLAWLDVERLALIAAVTLAAASGRAGTAVSLAWCLAGFLEWRRDFDDMITTGQVAVDSANHAGDRRGEAGALTSLGLALREVRRFDEAITAHQQAAALLIELGDRRGEAGTLTNLGVALEGVRRFDEAITAHQQAAALFTELGERLGEAMTLDNLGGALQRVRRFDEAITAHQQAAALFAELGDRHGEAMALTNLGGPLREVRRFDEAITAHQQAAALFELGDQHREAMTLDNLGLALQQVRRFDEAITAHQQGLALFAELGDRHSEAGALTNLGVALEEVRRFDEAITVHQQAAALFAELGDRHGEAGALDNLGVALQRLGRSDEAITVHQQAAALFTELGDRHGEAMTLENFGVALQRLGRSDEAITVHQQTLDLLIELGDRHGEAMALDNLGIALRRVRRFDEAITAHQQAAALFAELGDRHREGMALRSLVRARVGRMKSVWRVLTRKGRRSTANGRKR
jgi:tetratricopeptide (TPR) repeat protein